MGYVIVGVSIVAACLGFLIAIVLAGGAYQKGYNDGRAQGIEDGANALADQLRAEIRDRNRG